ncbi:MULTISPECIES: hypothetical protein [Vibrio harveyi group]|uniref:hypothetical protein n=1 Tax=Vibrio harveyi group TaxID=717610 RepID=UPI0009F1139D|nr:hypothetical protein [Vibrio parahaemolyticus]EKO3516995.1 hypothetical protein [Vibrio fluvialis]EJG0622748.1 hypothetical protein [Vibrio parahaemolyticus]EJG0640923.1 hypothetical protein [Vibrio parahaemolyticus]EJG0687797.1 hypothetical protein [Vibrio parahaemolyticus]EJG0702296.1 hypothetical protein [Vibrio parahaemolyticus]
MSEIPVNVLVPVGVVIAALIAGAFSFLSLVLTKEQQISQLRQNWIDALRDDISKYISALVATEEIYWAMKQKHGDSVDVLARSVETKEEHQALAIAYSNIMMRLNPDDKSKHQKELRNCLVQSKKLASKGKWDESVAMVDSIRDVAQLTLKEEWERVKVGEPSFVRSKRVAVIGVIIALLAACLVIYNVSVPLEPHVIKN